MRVISRGKFLEGEYNFVFDEIAAVKEACGAARLKVILETGELVTNAAKKLKDKNLDMIVANNVSEAGAGFDVDTNVATILDRAGTVRSLPLMSKDELAEQILDHLLVLKNQR